MPGEYFIFVRDKDLKIKEIVDVYKRLELIQRYNKVGAWRLELDFNTPAAQAFINAFGEVDENQFHVNQGKSGILVRRNGSTFFSGPLRYIQERWTKDGHILIIGGPDDLTFADKKNILPSPYDNQTSYTSADVYFSGSAEYCIKQLVDTQLKQSGSRALDFVTVVANQDRGYGTTQSRTRFDNLLKEVQRIAGFSETQGIPLGFSMIQSGTSINFDCYLPPDKSASVIFSPDIGNVREYEYNQEAPEASYVLAGDGGTGIDRNFAHAGLNFRIYGRIETFYDAGIAQTTQELTDEVYKALADYGEKTELRFIPIELPGFEFQTNWSRGDKISFRLRGQDVKDIVREVHITITPEEGEIIVPSVGNLVAGSKRFRLYDRVYEIDRRLRSQENY